MAVENLNEFRRWGRRVWSDDPGGAGAHVLKQKQRVFRAVFNDVVRDSPFDTGRFRGSWRPSNRVPDTTTEPDGKPFYRVPGAEVLEPVIARMDLKTPSYITNALPYARRLAFGWSKQASSGWVRRIVARAVRKVGL